MADTGGVISRRAMILALAAAAAGCGTKTLAPPGQSASSAVVPEPPAPPELPLPVGLARDASPEFRAVTDALVGAMRQTRIPGAALGILSGGREEHASIGVASLSSLRPVTPDTLFQIGSLTKTFTATAIWRLVDERKMAIDAPVRRYLRGLRLADEQTAATVTVGNLLDHTAGWYGDEGFDTGDDPFALGRYVDTRLPELPQLFACGEFFSYNNSAFQLLGRLVELTTTTDYNDAMGRLVFGPLGLANTVLDRGAVLKRPYADGHTANPINGRPGVAVQTPLWVPRGADPAGGIWSTTRDVLRYARMHISLEAPGLEAPGLDAPGRPPVLSPQARRAMQEPVVPVPGLNLSMGRSWFCQDIDGVRTISHDGATMGQQTVFLAVPQRRFALVVLLNGQPGAQAGLAALNEALARYPGLAPLSGKAGLFNALLVPDGTPTVDSGELRDYAGRYSDPGTTETFRIADPGLERSVELTPETGSWQPAIPPPAPPESEPVGFLGPDIGVVGGMRLPFVRNRDGQVGWVADGLRLRPRAPD